ncbi:MAG: ABC transporter permease [Candidatus Dormiibacterota bacterium]
MNPVANALWNPIVAKEYRSRMRTWRSPLAMTVYIVLLGGIGWAVFSAITGGAFGLGNSNNYGQMGLQLFGFLTLFQVALIAFITPALTAGAISGERERQTIDLLFVTPIPPFSIIWGKLLASMSFIVLLLGLSIPIFSLVFLFGGIELDQMLEAFLVTAVTALTLGLVGIALSTIFRRTLVATVAAYGAAFVLLVGTLIYGLLFPVDINTNATTIPAPPAITMLGPVLPLLTITGNAPVSSYGVRFPSFNGGQNCTTGPNGVTTCFSTSAGPASPVLNLASSQPSGTAIPTGLFTGWQYWQASIVMQLVICLAALICSALVLPPVHRFRLRRRPLLQRAAG